MGRPLDDDDGRRKRKRRRKKKWWCGRRRREREREEMEAREKRMLDFFNVKMGGLEKKMEENNKRNLQVVSAEANKKWKGGT